MNRDLVPDGSCFLREKVSSAEHRVEGDGGKAGGDIGGVKNPGVPAVLFQGILFSGASLRPVVLKSDPQTRAGLQTISTEIKDKLL